MSLKSFIARIGTDPQFVAFNAHWGFAFFAVVVAQKYGFNAVGVATGIVLTAAVKEFWFDARYEVPKQTFADNLEDFFGYFIGATMGVLFV